MTIKRVAYTTGQLLTAKDFQDEQNYHREVRRRVAGLVRTPGILGGLTLDKDNSGGNESLLVLSPGVALDKDGHEIVLTDALRLDISDAAVRAAMGVTIPAGPQLYGYYVITIAYGEIDDPADKRVVAGKDAWIRKTEQPQLKLVACGPGATPNDVAGDVPADSINIRIGRFLLANDGKYINADSIRSIRDLSGIPANVGIGTLTPRTALHVTTPDWKPYQGMPLVTFGDPDPNLGSSWVAPLTVHGGIAANGDSVIGGNLTVTSNLTCDKKLFVNGNLEITGAKQGYVVDRFVNRIGDALELGDVVVVGADQPALHYGLRDNIPVPEVDFTKTAYDTRVCGIVCEVIGQLVPETGDEKTAKATAKPSKAAKSAKAAPAAVKVRPYTDEEIAERGHGVVKDGQVGFMVTLGAFAHCKVDADIAPIAAGDLLTTSTTPGHAQKVLDRGQALGAIVGKALAPLTKGKGRIPVMVMLS